MKISLKVSAALLAAIMLFSLIPFYAIAQEGEEKEEYFFFESFEYPVGSTAVPKGWTVYTGTAGFHFSEDKPTEGKTYAVIEDNSSTYGAGFRSQRMPFDKGDQFIVEGDVMLLEGSGGLIFVEYWDVNGNRVDYDSIEKARIGEWTSTSAVCVPPENAVSISLLLYSGGTHIGVGAYDNIKIKKIKVEETVERLIPKTKSHPRLFFTSEELPSFIESTLDPSPIYNGDSMLSYRESVLQSADRFITETKIALRYYEGYVVTFNSPTDMPGKLPNPPGYEAAGGSSVYPYWTNLAEAIQERMQTLSIAYAITGEEKYAEKAIQWVNKMISWSTWSDPYYGTGSTSLDTCHITMGVATVYDILYDKLSADERKAIETAIYEKSLKKLYIDVYNRSTHNSQMLKVVTLLTGACAVFETEEQLCSLYITRAIEYIKWYMDEVLTSPQNEGLSYTSYTVEHMMIGIDFYSRIFGDMTLFDHEFINSFIPQWIVTAAENLNGLCANIGDCYVSNKYFFVTASIVYKLTKDPLAGYYLMRNKSSSSLLEGLLYTCTDIEKTIPDEKYHTHIIPSIDWGIFRTGWSPSDPTMFFVSGQSFQSHSHSDANSFSMALNGAWIADETGYRSYAGGDETEYGLSGGHNTIHIDGESQTFMGVGNLKECITSPFFGMAIGSAEKAYPKEMKLNTFDRTFIMVDFGTPYYIIRDILSSDNEHEYTWRLNIATHTSFDIPQGMRSFDVRYAGASLAADFAFDDLLSIKKTNYKSTVHPVIDVTSEKKKDQEFLAVLTPYMEGEAQYDLSAMGNNYTLSGDGITAAATKIDIFNAQLVRPKSYGDSIAFSLTVPYDGEYDIDIRYITGKTYGAASLSANGQELGIIDTYKDGYIDRDDAAFSKVALKGGTAEFKFTWCESAAEAADKLGLIHIKLTALDTSVSKAAVQNSVSGSDISGAVISSDGGASRDIIIFNNASKAHTWEGLSGNGSFSAVFGIEADSLAGYVMENGTELKYGDKLLASSAQVVSAMINFQRVSVITSKKDTAVTLALSSDIESVKLNDETYINENGSVTLNVRKGESLITFVKAESGEGDPSVEEPKENGGGFTLIIIIAAVSLAVIAAAVIITVKSGKKQKNP